MGKKTGAAIKEARTAAGLTQEALAKKITGLTASDVSKAERGEKELTQAVLKQIAKALGVTQSSLLNAETQTAAKKTAARTASKTTAKTAAKTTASKSSGEMKLTAAEKTLVELYRKADAETKKSAVNILKGEKNEIEQLVTSLFGDALGKLGKLK